MPLSFAAGSGIEAVVPHKVVTAEFPGAEILGERGTLALARRAVAARAGRFDHDRLVRRDGEVRRLGGQHRGLTAVQFDEAAGAAVAAAEQPPGTVDEALALAGERHGVADRTDHATQAEPTAMFPGSA